MTDRREVTAEQVQEVARILELAQQHRIAEAAKAAWIAGFQAARHRPNHSIPVLSVEWEGSTPKVVPKWSQRMRGYIG